MNYARNQAGKSLQCDEIPAWSRGICRALEVTRADSSMQHVQTPEVARAYSRVAFRYSGQKLFFSGQNFNFSGRNENFSEQNQNAHCSH